MPPHPLPNQASTLPYIFEVGPLKARITRLEAALKAALNILEESGLHDGPDSDDWMAAALKGKD